MTLYSTTRLGARRSSARTSGVRNLLATPASALSWTASFSFDNIKRQTRSTSCPSTALKSIGPRNRAMIPNDFFTCSSRTCGIAIPLPTPVDPSSSRFRRALKTIGHLEKFFSPSRYESDSLTAMGHGRIASESWGRRAFSMLGAGLRRSAPKAIRWKRSRRSCGGRTSGCGTESFAQLSRAGGPESG